MPWTLLFQVFALLQAEVEAGSIAELREKALHEGELMPSSNLKDTPGVGDQDVSAMDLLSMILWPWGGQSPKWRWATDNKFLFSHPRGSGKTTTMTLRAFVLKTVALACVSLAALLEDL